MIEELVRKESSGAIAAFSPTGLGVSSGHDMLHKGFYDALTGYSDVAVSHSFAEDYTFDAGRAEMQRLLRADPADAYFCGDDVLSIGALSAIADAGLSVPRDIGIVGLNDMEMARWENINLTTLHQPIAEIIEASIEKITNTLKGSDQEPEALLFPCHIVERGTLRKMP